MKTLKKIAVLILATVAVASVQASTLYWQVQSGTTSDSFDYALLRVVNDGGSYGDAITSPSYALAGAAAEGSAPNQYVSVQNTDLGTYGADGYSFFVEMATYNNGSWTPVARGQIMTYDQLVSAGYVANDFIGANSAFAAASAFNMGAVPEPTSGLLLLMGGAMLALRRRRQK